MHFMALQPLPSKPTSIFSPHCNSAWLTLRITSLCAPVRLTVNEPTSKLSSKKMSSPLNIPNSQHLIICFSGYWHKSHMAFSLWVFSSNCFLLTQFCFFFFFPFSVDQVFLKVTIESSICGTSKKNCSNNKSSNRALSSPRICNTDTNK